MHLYSKGLIAFLQVPVVAFGLRPWCTEQKSQTCNEADTCI